MGNIYAKVIDKIPYFSQIDMNIVMLGLDNAGKTSILYKLKSNMELNNHIPTIGFNVETLKYKNLNITVWDVGGQDKIRKLWLHYFTNTNYIIYIIDGSDRDRIDESCYEFYNLLNIINNKNIKILLVVNKIDMENVMYTPLISHKFKLNTLKYKWDIIEISALHDIGLNQIFDKIYNNK
tara:strand:- start:34065 stop:34604 length:540 start_codon:yes stop_codon:yes gene_type:complete